MTPACHSQTIAVVYHDQTRMGGIDSQPSERGNCDKTCLATLIGCDPSEIPDYQELNGDAWWQERDRFLHTKGFHVVTFGGLVGVPGGMCIAAGKSPRGKYNHAVVARVTGEKVELLHDPHPSRAFLDGEPNQFDFVMRLIGYAEIPDGVARMELAA